MSKFKVKKIPPIKLTNLLKKKKISLASFIMSAGIVTYQKLIQYCQKIGVDAPEENEFQKIVQEVFSSPQDGIIVLDSPSLIKENTGKPVSIENILHEKQLKDVEPVKKKKKKSRK